MWKKTLQTTLAAILAVSFSVPLAACQQANTNTTQTSGETYRWENFDDGSDVLDLDVPYIPSNTDTLSFKVVLEKGKLADAVGAEAVALGGGLDGWKVDAAERSDDVTLAVRASRPEGLANNGASLASVTLAADCVTGAESDSSGDSASAGTANSTEADGGSSDTSAATPSKDEMMSADEVNTDKGVVWPEDAVVVNKDEEATSISTNESVADTPEEVASLLGEIESGKVASEEDLKPYEEKEAAEDATAGASAENADEGATTTDTGSDANAGEGDAAAAGYEVSAVFANPALSVDFTNSKLDGAKFTAALQASDFVLSNTIGTGSFTLEGAEGCTLSAASFKSERELSVEIALPHDGDTAALDDATLTLKADANETQGDVACAIAVPDAWLDLDYDYADEAAGTTTFTAALRDATGELSAGNVTVEVNGSEVSPTSVAPGSDGIYSIVLKSADAPAGATIVVSASGARDVLGRDAETLQAAALVGSGEESREFLDDLVDDLMLPNIAGALGKKALFALAEYGWKQFYTSVTAADHSSSLYEVSNNEIFSEVVQIHDQVTDLSYEMKALSTTVRAGQKAALVTDAERVVARIRTQYTLLKDEVEAICEDTDGSRRAQKLSDFAVKEKATLDELATNMGELYTIICKADSATSHDLVAVYDEMMALSYNWGTQTYRYRQSFRGSLACVWTNAAYVLRLAYGAQTEAAEAGTSGSLGSKRSYLDELDAQSKEVNAIVNERHKIDIGCARSGGGWGTLYEYSRYDDYRFQDWIDEINTFVDDPQEKAEALARAEGTRDMVAALKAANTGSGPLVLYCNTTGTWARGLRGSDTADKWDKGFVSYTGSWWKKSVKAHLASPFRAYTYDQLNERHVVDEHLHFKPATSWDSSYFNTAQANAMLSRLADGTTLKAELEDVGLTTAKYLVTSERFDNTERFFYDNNDWYFDSFETAKATNKNKAFTKEKQHYDASKREAVVVGVKHVNWMTSASDMFVLQKTTVKKAS